MGYKEAMEDGIKAVGSYYLIPCSVCKTKQIKCASYSRKRTYTCDMCKAIAKGKSDPVKAANKALKFHDAVSRIELVVGDLTEYREAMEKVQRTLDHAGWYRSTEEIMAAIELLKNGVKTIHQQKIGRYSVDFVLPEYKVLLEIDGKPFHNNHTLEKEGIRDGQILLSVGVGWEIIRIDTDKINKDIRKLLPSIEAILEYRQAEKKRLHKA